MTFDNVVKIRCGNCDCDIYMRDDRQKELARTGRDFYCPNGHCISYKPSGLEKELAATKARAERAERDRDSAAHRAALAKRREEGACKLCPRVLDGARGLAIHMARIHPRAKALAANAGPDAHGKAVH